MDKLFEYYSKSCLSRALYTLLLSGAALVACGCLAAALALVPESLLDRDVKPFVLVGGIAMGGIVLTVIVLWLVLASNARVYGRFDQAFLPLGLTRSRYLLTGVQYQGNHRGRSTHVLYHVSGGRHARTPDLQIRLSGSFRTPFVIGTRNVLSRMGGTLLQRQSLQVGDPAYDELLIDSSDEMWARRLLGDPPAREAIERLVGRETPGVRFLAIRPALIQLHLRHFSLAILTPEAVRQWFDDLMAVAEIAEMG